MDQVISRHGVPLEVHIDQRKCFKSRLSGVVEFIRDQKDKNDCFTSSVGWSSGKATTNYFLF